MFHRSDPVAFRARRFPAVVPTNMRPFPVCAGVE